TIEALTPLEPSTDRDAMLIVAWVRTQQNDLATQRPIDAWFQAIERVGDEERETLARLALETFEDLDEDQRTRFAVHLTQEPPPAELD
ncbi:MAG: hypothetical protein KDA28_00340, partial [Phycisphaerales bacterium]|nr:hypothetical protein [Phycisphaerales bacterium]